MTQQHKKQKTAQHSMTGFQLPAGTQGFLLHCKMKRERRAGDEIINLFGEHAEQFELETTKKTGSVEKDFENELLELQNKDKQLFKVINTGISCCLFVKADSSIKPVSFLHSLMLELQTSGIKKTRYSTRILPMQSTCFANVSEVNAMAKEVLDKHLNNQEPSTYAIAQKIKHNTKFERSALIDSIAALVDSKHKVDLTNAQYYIIIEIINHVAGISVVTDYQKLKTYNIEQICS